MVKPQADSPGAIAKSTLSRLAGAQQAPTAENYCRVYRSVSGGNLPIYTYCASIRLVEESLAELVAVAKVANQVLEPETALIARDLGELLPKAVSDSDLETTRSMGRTLAARMTSNLADASEVFIELVAALRSAIAQFGTLGLEEPGTLEQIRAADELLAGRLSRENIVEARGILRRLLERQRNLPDLIETMAKSLKAIMEDLVGQVSAMAGDTEEYEGRMVEIGRHIQEAGNIDDLKNVVGEVGAFLAEMGDSVRHTREAMSMTQGKLQEAERQISTLRQDLAATSEKVQRDALTGTLNRFGLDEMWSREVKRAQANATPLSVGMLDVDNFKRLNDRFGHAVGDDALVHLATVIRQALHGTDTMARYGGEEFVILLPDTDSLGAEALMRRLQRELTKQFFLHNNERLLITFSAGVTTVRLSSDSLNTAIERANAGLYQAKRQGKNKVVTT
jgi:diguanylate cyclase